MKVADKMSKTTQTLQNELGLGQEEECRESMLTTAVKSQNNSTENKDKISLGVLV